ncbi:MAG TPA: TadE/TadG family type IV pilus assembly protein [Gemmataceae bacterium]|jgi:Flp pilus assembly protein TadG|nr:TadE/TadG family type IV pilus assembly protein [Gemmataceae bacterium]
MLNRKTAPRRRRQGALVLEGAVVYPAMFILLFGLIVGGIGVAQYQQVACQAREASRYAAVKGTKWAAATGKASPTAAQIASAAVLPFAAGMDPSQLTVQVQWIDGTTGNAVDWDNSSKSPTTQTSSGTVANQVRVTVSYNWVPAWGFVGPISLSSVSQMAMEF